MTNIIFDLDGTLIDSKPRLYQLFQYLVPFSSLSFEDYWNFKQDKISNQTILLNEFGYDQASTQIFVDNWMGLIESPFFLALDEVFPLVHETLSRLNNNASLHLCTARQYHHSTTIQLEKLDLLPYFNSVMITGQNINKEVLISDSLPGLSSNDWIIGDTGKDILVGRMLGINTCAVLTGFLSERSLLKYNPDRIINSVADFYFP